ncbi:hypothetical protein VP1G_09892 [Cytospora mali]|uniref:CCHC-type domain-containing protein n=1 Tax=Cytospora mali TaxID=578113 RepID=A0A194VG61_CYTMA|nr:hypothetical protein VP1G_09892 [Valsa mali var. pyri (nom. inval.)]
MERYDGASSSTGNQRDPRSFDNRPGELHMYVAPKEIQIGDIRDHNNRRLITLSNVPLGHNYIAPQINDGEEFAIGGDNEHIIKTLTNHLRYRSGETWHIVGIPESHLHNGGARASSSYVGVAGQGGSVRGMPTPQAPQQIAQASQGLFRQGEPVTQKDSMRQMKARLAELEEELEAWDSERKLHKQNVFGSSGQHTQHFQQGQHSGFPPQSFGTFGHGGGSFQGYTHGQQSFDYPQQGDFVGGQGGAQASSFSQFQQSSLPQQINVGGFGQGGAVPAEPMTLESFMGPQTQAATKYDALAPGAEVFYVPEEDDWIFQDPGRVLDQPNDGEKYIRNNGNEEENAGAASHDEIRLTPLLEPPMINDEPNPITKVLRANINSPGRFGSKAGTGKCDWCGRDGHEAIDCIKWDPQHFDKAVCIVCNNVSHSIDECPTFVGMKQEERAFLLLDKGRWRPGVRSRYHAWTDYCNREYWGQGFPMTRRFVRALAKDAGTGPVMQNVWKVWDYGQGVPREFCDANFDSARKIVLAGLDEKFETERPFSVYGDKVAPSPMEADDDDDESEGEGEGEGASDIPV